MIESVAMKQWQKPTQNPFKARVGAPLLAAVEKMEEKKQKAADDVFSDEQSEAAQKFAAVLYAGMVRKEFAFEKIRKAIYEIRRGGLYRQEVKRLVRQIENLMYKWDVGIGRMMSAQGTLDCYDDLVEYGNKEFDKRFMPFYYSILQLLTRHDVPHRSVLSMVEAARVLMEYSNKQMLADVGRYYTEAPQLRNIGVLYEPRLEHLLTTLCSTLSSRFCKGKGTIDLNADPMIETAADNLLRVLRSGDTINRYVNVELAPHFDEIMRKQCEKE